MLTGYRPIAAAAAAVIFFSSLLAAGAQSRDGEQPTAELIYFDDPFQVEITDSEGTQEEPDYGRVLLPGYTVQTLQSTAEIKLLPNGSIIKLAPQTSFTIKALQGRESAPVNTFALAAGRLRAVAAQTATGEKRYSIDTPAAVCGVRGTDFGLEVQPGRTDAAFVKEGRIDFTSKRAGKTISLGSGQAADAFAPSFTPISLTPAQMNSRLSGLDFRKVQPSAVPGKSPEPDASGDPEAKETPAEETAAEETAAEETSAAETKDSAASQGETDEEKDEGESGDGESGDGAGPESGGGLGSILGLQIGTTTINDTVYSKLILQPHIQIGKLDTVLYMPIIYASNLFDEDDWYHPEGNNEWSFGSDQSDALKMTSDFARDVALKFRYFQYGEPGMDNFFFSVGNLNTMTIGHGMLMRNYANDADFPAVRKLGMNFRAAGSRLGIEGVGDDLTDVSIAGGRIFLRPFKDSSILNLGISSVADFYPAGDLDEPGTYGDPLFVSGAADLEFFRINREVFDLMAYADAGAMVPVYRKSPGLDKEGNKISAGPAADAVVDEQSFRNFGALAGFQGRLAILEWLLEYRYYEGTFRPGFFGPDYDRRRGIYVAEINQFMADPDNPVYDIYNMGVYGQGDLTLFQHIVFTAGYLYPWTLSERGKLQFCYDDNLKLGLTLTKGLLPIDVEARLRYERTRFVETFAEPDHDLYLFDSNTVCTGELVYPISSTLDLAFKISTATVRDEKGNVVYRKDGVTPKITPTVDIETRISF